MINVDAVALVGRTDIEFGDELPDLAHLERPRQYDQRIRALIRHDAE